MRRKVLLLVLVLAGLVVAGVVYAQFYAPIVSEFSNPSEVGTEAEGPPAGVNASEDNDGTPKWWQWSKEEWQVFQWYANHTEVNWTYNETTGEKIKGRVIVAGEPLWKKYGYVGVMKDPLKYFEERKGACGSVPRICWMLFKAKNETVKDTCAENIDYNTNPEHLGNLHGWVEWIDKNGSKWVIDFDKVIPVEQWYQEYNWSYGWTQHDCPVGLCWPNVNVSYDCPHYS